ncbi:hypothetical protein HDV06_006666 [Boothiomyces sp. JEL0866]|nr:hypothetical protein HDV06_006666 [Boothiomyces sp. JEL0866]
MSIVGLMSNLETLFVILIDIEILRIYTILIPQITNRRLDIFRYVMIVVFVLFAVIPSTINTLFSSKLTLLIGNLTIALFSVFVVIYDNFQHISLAVVIYRFKEVKYNKELTEEMLMNFKSITKLNIAVVTLDWTAVGFYVFFMSSLRITYQSLFFDLASIFCICLHSLALVYILQMLKQFTIAKKPKAKVVTQQQLLTNTVKMTETGKINTSIVETCEWETLPDLNFVKSKMDKLTQYYASSDEEEEITGPSKPEPKKPEKRKIYVPSVEVEEHHSNLKPELGPNLLASIPKAQATNIKNISFGKLEKKPAKRSENVELDCFFTLPGQEQEELGPEVGPQRPSGQYNLAASHIKKKVKVVQEMAIPERKSGPVKITTISQKDQIGDVYKLNQQRQFTKSDFKASDSFKNISTPLGKDRNNHILSLASQAMQQSDKMAEQKAERNALKKTVRSKYGF